MAERTFDLQVSGYTKEGYPVTLTAHDVNGSTLATALKWIPAQMIEAGVLPSQSDNSAHRVDPPGWPDTKICPIHKEEMTRHEKGKSHWWSHKVISEDGSETWCRGK